MAHKTQQTNYIPKNINNTQNKTNRKQTNIQNKLHTSSKTHKTRTQIKQYKHKLTKTHTYCNKKQKQQLTTHQPNPTTKHI